jgi:hypothetical protein
MSTEDKPFKALTLEEAEKLLPEGDTVHTFRQGGLGLLVGADWSKTRILERFQTHGVGLSGDTARNMNHGLASFDDTGWLFIETRRQA